MSTREVHWHEGMFLRPHHFQTAQRHLAHVQNRSEKWDQHYNWGLRSIELDLDALSNYRLVVRSLQARLRDGTLIAIPEDGLLPAVDLKAAFEKSGSLTVFVAAPLLHLGRANAASGTSSDSARFLLDTQELEDENTGVNPQAIQVRMLNLRLMLSTEDHAGFEVLPIARIEKSPQAEATPQLDQAYIPPVLACDAWKPLYASIIQGVYDRIGKKIEMLSEQVVTRNITFDSPSQGDPLILAQLRELNEAYAMLGVLAFAKGVHPLTVFTEFARLTGQLAIFGATRRPPNLPHYDHDDLGQCFYRVKQYLDALLDILVEPEYKERPFVGAGLRMQVTLEQHWLESVWRLYLGVQSTLDAENCVRLLTKPGQLDMKIGSSDRVDTIYRLGQAGMNVTYAAHPPRALPSIPGQIYFQISRDSQPAEWQHVLKSLTLAIRLNEGMIAGNIQAQQILTIKHGGQTNTLQFTLYVVPQDSM